MLTVGRLTTILLCSLQWSINLSLEAQNTYEIVSLSSQFNIKNEQTIPEAIVHQFKNDAARIALRNYKDLSDQSVQIAPSEIDLYYSILSKLYLQDEQIKNIIRCKVKTKPIPSTDYIKLIFDRTVSWAQPLREGISSTRNSFINSLIEQHDLIIELHEYFDARRDAITIRAAQPINMASIANQLYTVEGIEKIDLGTGRDRASDIIIQPINQGWEIQFILLFKEENVQQQHIWYYEIDENGSFKLTSETGAPIPEWMQCY